MSKFSSKNIKSTWQIFVINIKKVFSLTSKFKWLVVVSSVMSLILSALNVASPIILGTATNMIVEGLQAEFGGYGHVLHVKLIQTLALYLVIVVLIAVISVVKGVLGQYVAQTACRDLRSKIAKKITTIKITELQKCNKGDVISRVTNDVDMLGLQFSGIFETFITSIVLVIGSLVMMLYMNALLTLIIILVIPVTGFITSRIVKRSQKYIIRGQKYLGEINGYVEEQLNGIETTTIFNKRSESVNSFEFHNDRLYDNALKITKLSMLIGPIISITNKLCYLIVVIVGAIMTVNGLFSIGGIQAFVQYMNNFSNPFTAIANLTQGVQQLAAASDRINEFLELNDESSKILCGKKESAKLLLAKDQNLDQPVICFKNVRFSYDKKKQIIKDVSFDVKQGETIAIVGPTGSGKTTLASLLMKLNVVDEGSICLYGENINKHTVSDVRDCMASVLQKPWLFEGSIIDNIRYGNLNATEDELRNACKVSMCDEFVSGLKDGYDFVVNEDNTNLSAGQVQLITIARAVVANKPLLILDEATSNVDTKTESDLYKAFDNVMDSRTSIVIAHRLSTITKADKILVLNNGQIVESGTHKELINTGGFYSKIFKSQFVK